MLFICGVVAEDPAVMASKADICFLAPIAAGEVEGRSRIAELARDRIVAAMHADA